MGCASSTPMVQTTGSEILKAATHVASDATKTAEDAVEGIKDSVGKTLETTKDSVATTVESVKHEVENVVKEKTGMLEDAKNSVMEKLHLKQTEDESNSDNSNKMEENILNAETDELKTQLMENSTDSNDNKNEAASDTLKQTVTMKDIKEHVLTRTDTETDSLKTSTPEPEIEEALAKSIKNPEDGDDNPPTPKPTLTEFENLTDEFLNEQRQQADTMMVNDIKNSNDPLMSVMHENIKKLDSNNMMSLTSNTNNNTIENNEPTTAAAAAAVALTINDIKSNNMHNTPQVSTAVHANSLQPLFTMATSSAIATVKAATTLQPQVANEKENVLTPKVAAVVLTKQSVPPPFASLQQAGKQGKLKNTKEATVDKENDSKEKRPRTTEWEKFADMLAQMRKFNPHDVFLPPRRTKFGGGGFGQLRERSYLGHLARNGLDDDSSDTNSILQGSPVNSQRSSARAAGRGQRLPNRPNTGNNRKKHNGGGNNAAKARRSSNAGSSNGRKFDFNPTRTRVSDFVSSTSAIQPSLYSTATTQLLYAPYSNPHESVESPANMRTHQSRNETRNLPALETLERTRKIIKTHNHHHHHHHHHHQHLEHDYAPFEFDNNDSSMPLHNDICSNEIAILTRQSSNASLFSKSSYVNDIQHQDERLLSANHHPSTVKNTSSFLTTPRCSPFSLRKSYTDLYFSTTGNKENKLNTSSDLGSKDKSPFKVRKSSKKHCIK